MNEQNQLPPSQLNEGTKFDDGKVDLTNLPWRALAEVARNMEMGAAKYARNNYLGLSPERTLRAAFRHLVDCVDDLGSLDDESKSAHLIHAATEVLFTLEICLRGPEGEKFKFNLDAIARAKAEKQASHKWTHNHGDMK